jgi:hypothetical protein
MLIKTPPKYAVISNASGGLIIFYLEIFSSKSQPPANLCPISAALLQFYLLVSGGV